MDSFDILHRDWTISYLVALDHSLKILDGWVSKLDIQGPGLLCTLELFLAETFFVAGNCVDEDQKALSLGSK